MNKLHFAKHLNDEEYELLLKVYANHNRSVGLREREKYSLSHIVKVERNIEENCLNVYYEDEWWHYCKNGTWY